MNKLLLTALLLAASPVAAEPAPALYVDANRVTVSGISAGGQMAHQMHVAYSDIFSGAGIIAGGPFGCANGSLATAMARCMGKVDAELPVTEFAASITDAAGQGLIAPVSALNDDPVWLFHGTDDHIVAAQVSDALDALYREFVEPGQVRYVSDVAAGHVFPASGATQACNAAMPPYVGDCGIDTAGELLQHLYEGLQPPATPAAAELIAVDLPGAAAAGLSDIAYLYVPPACLDAESACAAHLVLHGCAQSATQVGTDFMEQSGYLPWAQANDIVLAFPQVVSGPANPLACWDWWGYTGADYRWRDGAQMAVLASWIRGLAAALGAE